MTLNQQFRKFRKKQKNIKIIKLVQGDNNLIAELGKLRNKKKYSVKVFMHKGKGLFKILESKTFSKITDARKQLKKVVERF